MRQHTGNILASVAAKHETHKRYNESKQTVGRFRTYTSNRSTPQLWCEPMDAKTELNSSCNISLNFAVSAQKVCRWTILSSAPGARAASFVTRQTMRGIWGAFHSHLQKHGIHLYFFHIWVYSDEEDELPSLSFSGWCARTFRAPPTAPSKAYSHTYICDMSVSVSPLQLGK